MDIERLRRETPGCEHVLHFNNAGAALPPRRVLDAVIGHLELEANIGGYEAADRQQEAIEAVYDAAAQLVHCRRDEIALVEHATRAWDLAFYSVPFKPGDRILTSVAEYAANYVAFLHAARRTGVVIEVIPNDESGQVDVGALERMIGEGVRLVAINHIPTNTGLVNPAAAIGRIARAYGVLYLLDACQSIGQMPIDVGEIGCDFLSATGRKFLRGPRGTGFLFVRADALDRIDPPMLDHHGAEWVARDRYALRSDARRFENWEASYACRLGLGTAIECALELGLEPIRERAWGLAAQLRDRLDDMDGVTVRDLGAERCAITTFTVAGCDPADVKRALARRAINVTVSDAFAARIDMEERELMAGVVRASVHYYNTEDEIEIFCRALGEVVQELLGRDGV